MTEHREKLALSSAAILRLQALSMTYQAEVLRGADREALDAIRAESHALLDALLDINAEVANNLRNSFPA